MRLLLSKDNPPLRVAIARYLREAGYLVDVAAKGDEGLWAASENPYDVILLDLTAFAFRLLEYLFYRAGEVVTRRDFWERVFEDSSGGSSNTVDVHIGYLRKNSTLRESPISSTLAEGMVR